MHSAETTHIFEPVLKPVKVCNRFDGILHGNSGAGAHGKGNRYVILVVPADKLCIKLLEGNYVLFAAYAERNAFPVKTAVIFTLDFAVARRDFVLLKAYEKFFGHILAAGVINNLISCVLIFEYIKLN